MITAQRMRARQEAARAAGAPPSPELDRTPYAERIAVQEAQKRLSLAGGDPHTRILELELKLRDLPEFEEAMRDAAAALEQRGERVRELEGGFERLWNRVAELEAEAAAKADAPASEGGGDEEDSEAAPTSSKGTTSSKSTKKR